MTCTCFPTFSSPPSYHLIYTWSIHQLLITLPLWKSDAKMMQVSCIFWCKIRTKIMQISCKNNAKKIVQKLFALFLHDIHKRIIFVQKSFARIIFMRKSFARIIFMQKSFAQIIFMQNMQIIFAQNFLHEFCVFCCKE